MEAVVVLCVGGDWYDEFAVWRNNGCASGGRLWLRLWCVCLSGAGFGLLAEVHCARGSGAEEELEGAGWAHVWTRGGAE